MLLQRTLSALIGIPLGLFLIWEGGLWLTLAIALLAIIGFQEFHAALRLKQIEALREIGFPAVFAMTLGAFFLNGEELLLFLQGVLLIVVLGSLAFHLFVKVEGSQLASTAATVLGVLYIGFLFSFCVLVREMQGPMHGSLYPFGLRLFLVTWIATMSADIGAYFVGKALGRHKLCPAVSPGKTVEGVFGGILGALLAALALMGWSGFSSAQSLGLGLIAAVLGLIGDLSKSVIKREVGVKDFGSLIPGHGGVLDRFDSLLVTMSAAYFFALMFMR